MLKKFKIINIIFSIYACGVFFLPINLEKNLLTALIIFTVFLVNAILRNGLVSLILSTICCLYSLYMGFVIIFAIFIQSHTVTIESFQAFYTLFPIFIFNAFVCAFTAISALIYGDKKSIHKKQETNSK
jgi:hypothetical protein